MTPHEPPMSDGKHGSVNKADKDACAKTEQFSCNHKKEHREAQRHDGTDY